MKNSMGNGKWKIENEEPSQKSKFKKENIQ